MCQHCVETGVMTQEEMDHRILSGDTDVMPMMDLSPNAMETLVVKQIVSAIKRGMDRERALTIGAMMMVEYQDVTGRLPITDEPLS